MKLLFVILAFLIAAGCSTSAPTLQAPTLQAHADPPDILCENRRYSDEDLDTAVFDVIFTRVIHMSLYPETPSIELIGRAEAKLAVMRKWTDTITNPRIKKAYIDWLDYYAKEYADARSLRQKVDQNNEEERERKEKQARADALAKCLPIPESN